MTLSGAMAGSTFWSTMQALLMEIWFSTVSQKTSKKPWKSIYLLSFG